MDAPCQADQPVLSIPSDPPVPSTRVDPILAPVLTPVPPAPVQSVPIAQPVVPSPHSVPLLGERGSIIQTNPVTCSNPPIISHPVGAPPVPVGVPVPHTVSTQHQKPPLAAAAVPVGHQPTDVILTEFKRDDHLLQQFSYNPNSHSYQHNQS